MSISRYLSIFSKFLNSSGIVSPSGGGTGIGTIPTNGQIPIGNGTNYVPANITAGTGITISNSAGGVTITNNNPTNIGLGINQTWHDVTSSRSTGVNYTNTLSVPIAVNVQFAIPAANYTYSYINGSLFGYYGNGGNNLTGVTAFLIVPPGTVYNFSGGVATLLKWWELY